MRTDELSFSEIRVEILVFKLVYNSQHTHTHTHTHMLP